MIGDMDITPAAVLVIESHPLMREALCSAITEEPGLAVAETDPDNPQSLTILTGDDILFLPQKPDMILLALGNPGFQELDVLKALRAVLPETPLLALTSNEVPGQEQAAREAGACAVLTKAASRLELIDTLRGMWKHSHPTLGEEAAEG